MIIHFATTTNRRKVAREGDRKVVRGVEYVRQWSRVRTGPDRGWLVVSRGRPVYEWVRADAKELQA